MRSLPEPDLDAHETFDSISRSKAAGPRHTLQGLRDRVTKRFEGYRIADLGSLSAVGWTDAEQAALLLCYESPVEPRTTLRRAILSGAGQYCPYCGMDRPTTVDHYVPKDQHPEFSIFPPNLIGCCHECNNRKGTAWIESGRRLFLHVYFDHFPAGAPCLVADIDWIDDRPMFSFRLVPHASVPQPLFQVLVSHVERLQLLRWYAGRAEEEFDDLDDFGEVLATADLVDLIQRKKVRRYRQRWGPLSWKAALWEAVIGDDGALRHLQERFAGEPVLEVSVI